MVSGEKTFKTEFVVQYFSIGGIHRFPQIPHDMYDQIMSEFGKFKAEFYCATKSRILMLENNPTSVKTFKTHIKFITGI